MNPALIFGVVASVGLVCLGFGGTNLFSIVTVGLTLVAFWTSLFFSLKAHTQKRILIKICRLPLPDWLTPLNWLISVAVMIGTTVLLCLLIDHFGFFDGTDLLGTIAVVLVATLLVIISYWALVGSLRYFNADE